MDKNIVNSIRNDIMNFIDESEDKEFEKLHILHVEEAAVYLAKNVI